MGDLAVAIAIMIVEAIVVSGLWIAYNAQRLYEVRREHSAVIEKINADYAMQRRLYGNIPVEQLLGREDTLESP